MHICFLCNEYPPDRHGGVGSMTQTLARWLVARGDQATVVGIYPASRAGVEDDQGVRIVRLPHSSLRGTGLLVHGLRLNRALQQLHAWQPIDVLEGPELSLATLARSFPATAVVRMNGGHHFFASTLGRRPRRLRGWLEQRSLARAQALCAVSHFVADTTRALLRLGDRPIAILPNAVDTMRFSPRPSQPEEQALLLFVGTVCEKKGVRQLVQAMPQIVAAVPGARLLVVGRDWPDPQSGRSFTAQLQALIPDRLRSQICFAGALEHRQLPDVLARAALCVLPSHMEALPVAWLEAMAMGKAVVASQTGPGPEVIENQVSGLLCDPHDPRSIAEQVIRALRDDQLRRRLGQQARQRVVALFSAAELVERNQRFYQRCLEARHGA